MGMKFPCTAMVANLHFSLNPIYILMWSCTRFQKEWAELHEASRDCAARAQVCNPDCLFTSCKCLYLIFWGKNGHILSMCEASYPGLSFLLPGLNHYGQGKGKFRGWTFGTFTLLCFHVHVYVVSFARLGVVGTID